MLAPEVLDFPPPKSRNFQLDNDLKIDRLVLQQYFNHSVSMVIPDTINAEPMLEVLSTDTDYYHVARLPAHEMVNTQFISLFVKSGALTLHSIDTRLDHDNCLAITPKGMLILSLRKETFQSLGLEGACSHFDSNRFVLKLDLKSNSFIPGSKRHFRIVERLKACMEYLTFNVVMIWEPMEADVCPSSIAAWFSKEYQVRTCSNHIDKAILYDLKVPDWDDNDLTDLLEWTGMVLLGCETEPSNFQLSTYHIPSASSSFGQVMTIKCIGFLTASKCQEISKRLKEWIDQRGSTTWVSLIVNGMDDSVTTHGEQEHYFYVEGDYNITMFMRPLNSTQAFIHISSSNAPVGKTRHEK